ncbi:putative mitochondrial deoxynucleotide carrier protein [Calocera viscosa TUFC12733]|uniref:Putative mitochondrial deoxynucleotide carrier protein n=1 Tax=Calocera viscosa (strain TUFC12733) TaxID=1330018 RepID=A0A167J619_CALVF|nr:putative mitochondrial deoxynucleotide carrier protein [Calocera viscosa TUFC12733]
MPRVAGKEDSDKSSNLDVVIAGSTAGVITRFIIAPLDVVKIRLQLQHHARDAATPPTYRGMFHTMTSIMRDEGITGLWKGNIPAELLYLTYGAAQFYTYRTTHVALGGFGLPRSAQDFVAGGAAGACATFVTYPFDLLRTRFAAQGSGDQRIYTSLVHAVRTIYTNEGIPGFFQGVTAGVGQVIPYMGLFFATYEPTRAFLTRHNEAGALSLSGYESAVAGGLASTVAKTGVFPLDLIRKRLQVQGPTRNKYLQKDIEVYQGMRVIVQREGIRGLYRGLGVSLVKAAPNSAITMWCYEVVLRALKSARGDSQR